MVKCNTLGVYRMPSKAAHMMIDIGRLFKKKVSAVFGFQLRVRL